MFDQLKAIPKKVMEKIICDFNHNNEIRDPNAKKISPEETFGLGFLSEENQTFVQDLLYQIEHAPLLFLNVNKSTAQYKIEMRAAIQKLNRKKVANLVSEFKHDQQEYKLQLWYQEQNKILGNRNEWALLKKSILEEQKTVMFSDLQHAWLAQKNYSHFCAKAVIYLYNAIMPALKSYIKYAQSELKHRKKQIPKKIFTAYQNYLQEMENDVYREESQIRESILARLRTGIEAQDIANGDITVACAKKLHAYGAIKEETLRIPEIPRRDITPKIFDEFRKIIETTGWKIEKSRLHALPYYNQSSPSHDKLPVSTVEYEGRKFIAPKAMQGKLPKNKPWVLKLPNFISQLFKGTKVTYEFVQHPNFQYLLAQTNIDVEKKIDGPISLEKIDSLTNIKILKNIDFYLQSELQRIEKTKQTLSSFLQKNALCLLEIYKKTLHDFGLNLTEKFATILEKITCQIEQEKNKSLTNIEKKNLAALIDDLEKNKERYNDQSIKTVQSLMLARLHLLDGDSSNQVKQQHQSSISTTQKTATEIAETLLQNHIPTHVELENLLQALKQQAAPQDHTHQNLIMYVTQALKSNIPATLKKELFINPFNLDENEIKNHLHIIRNFSLLMQHQGKNLLSNNLSLQHAVYHYFQQFLITIYELGSETTFKKHIFLITKIQNMIAEIGDNYLKESIEKLQKSQTQGYDWHVFSRLKLKTEIEALTNYLQKNSINNSFKISQTSTSKKITDNPYALPFLSGTHNNSSFTTENQPAATMTNI